MRLLLILRAFHVNQERCKLILRPDKDTITQAHHVWPSLTETHRASPSHGSLVARPP